ncbi:hypothetical protein A2U01_0089728, partial [Trifolium medium]|nr:hypothetical protein [Trifolium medium]
SITAISSDLAAISGDFSGDLATISGDELNVDVYDWILR